MPLLTTLNKLFFTKNTSDSIKKQSVISSKRISEISFWEVYNEANEQYNHSLQQLIRMSQFDKVRELSKEKKTSGNHESRIFSEKSSKIKIFCTLFNFNEKKYKNGVRKSNDEFMFEDFKNLKFFL